MRDDLERLIRAYCDKAPDPNSPVHRRVVEIVDGKERETCKYCGHVKEHEPMRYADSESYSEQPQAPSTEIPDGYHIE